jgi:hypothetical protein
MNHGGQHQGHGAAYTLESSISRGGLVPEMEMVVEGKKEDEDHVIDTIDMKAEHL